MKMLSLLILASLASVTLGQFDLWIDCCPDYRQTSKPQDLCVSRGCWWSPKEVPNAPWCHFANPNDPSLMAGYDVTSSTEKPITANLKRRSTASLFGDDFPEAVAKFEQVDEEILKIVITDKQQIARPAQYPDVKTNLLNKTGNANQNAALDIVLENNPFGFAVSRRMNGDTLIDTRRIPGFTFAKQYLQISTRVPTRYLYGLGDTTHSSLTQDFNWKNWGIFAKDQPIGLSENSLYGSHPFYLCIDNDQGNAHGIFFRNTHAYNVALQPDPANPDGGIITWRFIGGMVEMYVLPGPTPDDVIRQYTNIIGKPQLPPYWSLGYQLSKYGYGTLDNVERVFDRNRKANIPQDAQTLDIDYMLNNMDFTTDPKTFGNLPNFVKKLHDQNMKLILIVDPAIANHPSIDYGPLNDGLKSNVFIKDARTGQPLEGKVWPGSAYFPDFTHPNSTGWWSTAIKNFHEKDGIQFDGLWIDMNEPSNFFTGSSSGCTNNKLNNPPYDPLLYSNINQQTACMDADQYNGKHYELHNVYGHTEGIATYKALQNLFPGKRPFILCRSTFPGSGKYVNHWTGDDSSLWSHMKLSIVSMLEYNMYGIPMVGADICGFLKDTNEEMCTRWQQLGSFYPFSRNHNDKDTKVEQDPAAWSSKAVATMRHYLELRYSLLPYFYTLFYQANLDGIPVARPLLFDFSKDKAARTIDDQFLLGPGLMVAPIIWQGATKRLVYFPQGRWYNLEKYLEIPSATSGRYLEQEAPLDTIPIYVRGGFILPWQDPATNTISARKNPFSILIGLDENSEARGSLFWDDGETEGAAFSSAQFEAYKKNGQGGVKLTMLSNGYKIDPPMNSVLVYGMQTRPSSVTVDGKPLQPDNIQYDADKKLLRLINLGVHFDGEHDIAWQY